MSCSCCGFWCLPCLYGKNVDELENTGCFINCCVRPCCLPTPAPYVPNSISCPCVTSPQQSRRRIRRGNDTSPLCWSYCASHHLSTRRAVPCALVLLSGLTGPRIACRSTSACPSSACSGVWAAPPGALEDAPHLAAVRPTSTPYVWLLSVASLPRSPEAQSCAGSRNGRPRRGRLQ